MAQNRPGHVHGSISGSDDGHRISQIMGIRIGQIINGKMDVAKAFPLDSQGLRSPYPCPDKDGTISVPEQIADLQRSADGRIRPDFNAET